MLKAQLRSKMFQLTPGWRDIEDILTGDFFGALDYLPRYPFLADFLSRICNRNGGTKPIVLKGVDWDGVEFLFWPFKHAEDESAEPDLVLISNRWVLVIEVKLESRLGHRQPWREYLVGKEIAASRNLSFDSVYYLLARDVAQARLAELERVFG